MNSDIHRNKLTIIQYLRSTHREGIEDLIKYLEESSYFNSPASTKYHNSFPGGLALHSLNVTEEFMFKVKMITGVELSDFAIISGLLHDLCKVGYYGIDGKGYSTVKSHPANKKHGVLSVEIAEKYIKLTDLEKEVIKYHMGVFSVLGKVQEYSLIELNSAISGNPWITQFMACDSYDANKKEMLEGYKNNYKTYNVPLR